MLRSSCDRVLWIQVLFYECVAEMKKAVVRMGGVAADALEEAASMVITRLKLRLD